MPECVGRVIEFVDGAKLKTAVVTAQSSGKLQVTDRGGRQHKVSEKYVVVVHAVAAVTTDIGERAEEIDRQVETLLETVDTELLWDSVRGRDDELELAGLAETYFGARGGAEQSAIFRAVSRDALRFRVRAAAVFARKEREIADQLNAQRRRDERETTRGDSIEWLRATLRSEAPVEIDESAADLVRRIEEWVWHPGRRSEELADWLERAAGDLAPAEAAYRILRVTGRIASDAERFLVEAGVREEFSAEVDAAAEALELFAEIGGARTDFTAELAFTIDDADTREVDDALTLQSLDDGLRVGIHIADVACFVESGGGLDREAARRGSTIYLPSRSVPMFPRRLSCDIASLEAGALRPSMSFVVDFDEAASVRASRIVRGAVRVTRRLDYEEADRLIAAGDGETIGRERRTDGLSDALRQLDRISAALLEARRARGALSIRRPELRVRARPGEPVRLEVLDGESTSRRIVSEMMILANSLCAAEARRSDVPIIYRCQDPPREQVAAPPDYDPVALAALFRSLERSQLSTHARAHSGLGLDCYTQATSPIRRFADLVIQRQFAAHLEGRPPPYDRDELLRVLAAAQEVERESRQIEDRATRFAVLGYLDLERREHEFDAIVVDRQRASGVVETTDLFVRGTLMRAGAVEPGDRIRVRIAKLDARRDVLIFEPVGVF